MHAIQYNCESCYDKSADTLALILSLLFEKPFILLKLNLMF
jgi:hypothetical protein